MNTPNKFFLGLFLFLLILVLVLGYVLWSHSDSKSYFSFIDLTTSISKKTDNKHIGKRISISSDILGLGVTISNHEKLDKVMSLSRIFVDGVPGSRVDYNLIKPKNVSFVLTDDLQPKARVRWNKSDDYISTSMGFGYSPTREELTIYIHYNENYIQTMTNNEFEHKISRDIAYYSYFLSGGKEQKTVPKIKPMLNSFIESVIEPNESWVSVDKQP